MSSAAVSTVSKADSSARQRPRLPYPTASQSRLLSLCPASFWGDGKVEKKPGEAAEKGTAIHRAIEAGFRSGVYLDKPAAGGIAASAWIASLALAEAARLGYYYEVLHAIPSIAVGLGYAGFACRAKDEAWTPDSYCDAYPEVSLGLARDGGGGIAFSGNGDPYSEANFARCVFGGRADLLTIDKNPWDRKLVILDWKTGAHDETESGPVKNYQLLSLAYMATKTPGLRQTLGGNYKIKLCVINLGIMENTVWNTNESEVVSLFDAITKRAALGIDTREVAGAHCYRCTRRGSCATFAQACAAFTQALAQPSPSAPSARQWEKK